MSLAQSIHCSDHVRLARLGVDLRRGDAGVSHQRRNGHQVGAGLAQQPGREGVAQHVGRHLDAGGLAQAAICIWMPRLPSGPRWPRKRWSS